jgi:hypothetical protein
LEAHDFGTAAMSTERVGFSTRPYIGVQPNVPYKFIVLTPQDDLDGVTDGVVRVSAGNTSNLGKTQISAQLSDQFNNYISSAGHGVQMSVINVVGATGTVKFYDGVSYNAMSATTTDVNGQIGTSPAFYYFVSTKAADLATIQFSSGSISATTLPLETTGGSGSKVVFISPPANAQAGVWSANQFTVERRDDFDNPTSESVNSVNLLLGTGQSAFHTADSKTYYFTEPNDQSVHIVGLTFDIGTSQKSFSYFDTMSSYPIGEDSRPGTWQIRVEGAPLTTAIHEFTIDPGPTATVGVDTPKRSIEAGKITYQGVVQPMQFELWDSAGNPTVTTTTYRIVFESTRTASPTLDAYGFVLSSSIIPSQLPNNTTAWIDITSGTYGKTFYYFDTHSSESYGVLSSSRPIIGGYTVGQAWRTVDHYVDVRPTFDNQNKVVVISTIPVLVAGSTTPVQQMQLQDKYSNPTPIIISAEDDPGQGTKFKLVSNSTGNYRIASPSSATFSNG